MSKNKKHRYTHVDPENLPQIKPKDPAKPSTTGSTKKEISNIGRDLRRVLITVAFSVIILVVFFFLNQKLDLIQHFGKLI